MNLYKCYLISGSDILSLDCLYLVLLCNVLEDHVLS